MKKLINLIALVMLVSTNVLTPFSYAEVENPEVIPENGVETVEECLGEVEEIPEINEETPELVPEEKGELEQENAENVAPENVLPDIQDDEETPSTDETEEDSENNEEAQPVEETPEKEIQDEEGKIEELEKVEESVVMDVIPNTSVMLLPGQEFNSVIKTLANGGTEVAYTGVDNNIQSFQRVDVEIAGVTTGEISIAGAEYPVHAWFSGGVLYYATKAEIIQLNEDSQNMFQNFGALTELDLSSFDTSNVTNIFGIFAGCSKLEEINLNGWDFRNTSVNMMNMTYGGLPLLKKINMQNTKFSGSLASAFAGLSNVEEIYLSGADTSDVTNIGSMFGGCSKLEKLNLEGWILTGNISNMFGGLSTLKEINLDGVNTKGVTNMSSMFGGCSSLIGLDLSSFDTSNVTTMNQMFNGCSKLENLDLSNWDTSNVTDVYGIFAGLSKLEELNLSGWDFSNTSVNMMNMTFGGLPLLKKINMQNTKFSGSLASAFAGLNKVEELNLSGADTSNVMSMGGMFGGCKNLKSLNLSGWNFEKVNATNFVSMLFGEIAGSYVTQLKDLNLTNTKFSGSMEGAFYYKKLENLILDGVDTSNVTDMSYMFFHCDNLTGLDLSSFDTSNVTNMNYMFEGSYKLQSLDVSSFNTSNVTTMYQMFKYYNGTSLDLSNFDTSNVTNMNAIFAGSDVENLNLSGWDFRKVATTNGSRTNGLMYRLGFYSAYSLKYLDMTNTKFTGNLSYAFMDLTKLEEIKLDGVNTEGVTNMSYMFDDCRSLKNLDVSSFDTSNVTDMSYMFFYCNSLTGLDLSNFDTSKVTNMSNMFTSSNLEELNLSGWVFTGSMSAMFYGLSNLRRLDLNGVNTRGVQSMESMFYNCSSLTGLDLSSFDTSNVTRMGNMFYGCSKLENLNLDDWVITGTSNTVGGMFAGASNLKAISMKNWTIPETFTTAIGCRTSSLCATGLESIDVTNWDLREARNLNGVFGDLYAKEIKGLDTWDTSNITDMGNMFNSCYNLTGLDLRNFDTSSVTNMGTMFQNCSSLENLILDDWVINNSSSTIGGIFQRDNNLKTVSMRNWTIPENFTHAIGCRTSQLCATGIESIDVSNWNLSGTKNLNGVFGDLYAKEIKGLETWDTSNITDMGNMFYRSYNLTGLDLSNFDTSNVTNMYSMFYNTSNLKTIYASENFVTTALSGDTSSKDMFSGTTSVVGGNGTKFDPNYIDEEYAKIDKVGQTGYFTDKNAINVKFISTLDGTETVSTFAKGQKLTPPPVNGYHAVGGYLDEAMTQAIDLNKGVDTYSEIYVKYERNGSSGGGGGGGGGTTKPDTPKEEQKPADTSEQVPQNDNSASSGSNVKTPENDTQMDSQPSEQSSVEQPEGQGNGRSNTSDNSYTNEQKEAYEFAKENGITTMSTIQKADMNGKLTRIQMAKMLSQYAINVLGQTPDTSKTVKFSDVTTKRDADYDNGVTLAYQLGIMGQNMKDNKFRPNDEVSRAEFVTALSRLLYSTSDGEYKSTSKYYIHHMEKLVKEGIITKDDPKMKERRGYVMIMLMRSAK